MGELNRDTQDNMQATDELCSWRQAKAKREQIAGKSMLLSSLIMAIIGLALAITGMFLWDLPLVWLPIALGALGILLGGFALAASIKNVKHKIAMGIPAIIVGALSIVGGIITLSLNCI